MGRSRDEARQRQKDAAKWLADHEMKPAETVSWRFGRPATHKHPSSYWFTLTWTPGFLTLTGDCGELVLRHYHALPTVDSIGWALQPDFRYLLEKTEVQKVYQADETCRYVLEELNRGAIEARRYERRERSDHRKSIAAGEAAFRAAHEAWRLTGHGEEPTEDEYVPEREFDDAPYVFSKRPCFDELAGRAHRNRPTIADIWNVPEGWELWSQAWLIEQGLFYPLSPHTPADIMKRDERYRVWSELEGEFEQAHTAVDLLCRLGFDDYYGDYDYPSHAYFQIAVIQHGVRMILAERERAAGEREIAAAASTPRDERVRPEIAR